MADSSFFFFSPRPFFFFFALITKNEIILRTEKKVRVCSTCHGAGEQFRKALLSGCEEEAMRAFSTGCVNLRVPYTIYHNEVRQNMYVYLEYVLRSAGIAVQWNSAYRVDRSWRGITLRSVDNTVPLTWFGQ